MIRPAALCSISILLFACGTSPSIEEPTGPKESFIINGTKITTLPAVGTMAYEYGNGYEENCTGTLIAPRKVITAAHCIDPGNDYLFITGPDMNNPANVYTIVSQKANPNYKGDTYDVGILTIDRDAAETPMQMNATNMDASWVGRNIYWVGYGVTNAQTNGGSGYKRAVNIPISSVDPLTFSFKSTTVNTCFGDSGGPGFWVDGAGTYWITGLTSWGDEGCAQFGVNTRVDKMLAWVQQQIGVTPTQPVCVADGQCNTQCTTTPDPDCAPQPVDDCTQNNVCAASCQTPDPDCTPVGQACTAGTECDSRLCVGDPQHAGKYCSQACKASTDCPKGMQCSTNAGVKACIFQQVPEKKLGEECTKADRCEIGTQCVAAGAKSYCYVVCTKDSDCDDGETCQKVSGGKVCGEAPDPDPTPDPTTGGSTSGGSTSGGSTSGGTTNGSATAPQSNNATTQTTGGCNSTSGAPVWALALLVALRPRRRRAL